MKLKLTSFETFDLLIHIPLRSLAFFLFLHLNLLPILFILSLPSLLLAPLDLRRFIQQTLTNALHVRVRLDHFGKVVRGACEWEFMFRSEGTGFLGTMEGLLVAEMFCELERSFTDVV